MSQNYNINMKKFNGTDYDGLLPLAYNALNSQQLDGKTFNEIQNLIKNEHQIITGSYVRNGTAGLDNPTIINIGFMPKLFLIFLSPPINYYDADSNIQIQLMDFYTNSGVSFQGHSLFYMPNMPENYYWYYYLNKGNYYITLYYTKIKFTNNKVELRCAKKQWRSGEQISEELSYTNPTMQMNSKGVTYCYIGII